MQQLLFVCPTHRDLREIRKTGLDRRHHVTFHGEDASEHLDNFDPLAYIEEVLKICRRQKVDGIISTDDYPGSIIASLLARELGLSSPKPEKILLCQHKYYCRKAQEKLVPEATPRFFWIDPKERDSSVPKLPFPFFVKPAKSFFSILAEPVSNPADLERQIELADSHLSSFVRPFNQLLKKYTDFSLPANGLIAEEILEGDQVTIEGFVFESKAMIIGIVDSVMYPGTRCFRRFDYPSQLGRHVQERMGEIAQRFIEGIGFDNGIFNIEMMYNSKKDSIHIIEVNPRLCSQFADLMEKVHGTNTYEIQIALALGKKPRFQRDRGKFRVASSFVLRTFEDETVHRLPSPEEIASLEEKFPEIRVEIFGRIGHRLSEELQDGKSYRYGLINLGGDTEKELAEKFLTCQEGLRFLWTRRK
ncbi:MAG: ATP-grasp domain-containing protein [Deltaproteobacteria bacterium]|nr:ATP-grasp domain-containing protein [Deltaproteobacteria bacterium]